MFQNILLPIDLNHPASWEKALPMAAELCDEGGTLHLLGIVHDVGSAIVANYLPADYETQAQEAMQADLETFASDNVPAATTAVVHVGHGHVSEEILKTAKAVSADLIVMASHAPDMLRTFLVGSQADRVVHHADRPVLVVR